MNGCKTIVIFARFDSYYVNWTLSKKIDIVVKLICDLICDLPITDGRSYHYREHRPQQHIHLGVNDAVDSQYQQLYRRRRPPIFSAQLTATTNQQVKQ